MKAITYFAPAVSLANAAIRGVQASFGGGTANL